jgi:hypothetical protein
VPGAWVLLGYSCRDTADDICALLEAAIKVEPETLRSGALCMSSALVRPIAPREFRHSQDTRRLRMTELLVSWSTQLYAGKP